MSLFIRNFLGSFADAAVLFPLLILLGASGQFSPFSLFASAGFLYFLSGIYFRIPMPVQPLKSIVIAGLAIGSTAMEIRLSAALLGLSCLLVVFFRLDSWMERVPIRVVHQVQVALGILLLFQAIRALGAVDTLSYLFVVLLVGVMLFLPEWKTIPWMGLIATSGVIYVAIQGFTPQLPGPAIGSQGDPRLPMALGLFFPQMALTFANSVIGTRVAAKAYFPDSEKVTIRGLLVAIGAGNIFMSLVGGLPFCHGSGGLTAHVRGGSNRWWSNLFIGSFLFLLALLFWFIGSQKLIVPASLVSALLFVTGIQHFRLARETFFHRRGKWHLFIAVLIIAFTQSLFWVLFAAFALEIIEKAWPQSTNELRLKTVMEEK